MTPNRRNILTQAFQDALLAATLPGISNPNDPKSAMQCALALGANAAVNELQAAEERGEIILLP